ncbi:MAG: ArsR/SmtB family transcription factor [Vulcanimicrobiota bacterium]
MHKVSDYLVDLQANAFKALAHPTRVHIIHLLQNGPLCVCEIVEELEEEYANVSRHLSKLSNASLVSSERRGTSMYYSLDCKCILGFIQCLSGFLVEKEKQRAEKAKNL